MKKALALALVSASIACAESPTALQPDPIAPDPTVSAVSVASPIGTILAVGRSAPLAASATDAAGADIPATFAWVSADAGVLTVTPSGLATAVAPGSTEVTATAEGVTGRLTIAVADADLAGIRALLDDELAAELVAAIGPAGAAGMAGVWEECDAALTSENLSELTDCVTRARTQLAGDPEPTTGPLRGSLGLFLDWIERLLNLK